VIRQAYAAAPHRSQRGHGYKQCQFSHSALLLSPTEQRSILSLHGGADKRRLGPLPIH
jgi:hypothetical protein